ncbi:hypothetical protein [Yersinia phage fHe-Yen9-04]|uniref:Uncharacterized protein n=2 Tax=Eneladusvirus Yen904 TaxID=2560849 RepID=A0A2C9CYU1_9CAUD|nr:hypothetical protein FDJ41_gp251 [Yersinia phage fHe-Yen9-04]SOK58528.1 hypothetical protein [Yersinia phage fHe-Yen9-04]SOK59062.1 hypothetical protein [Yersinia phage fHe-Yen9-03]VUE36297.1 hypothetical protein [Yersinia phage fHe-Yen9-04]
MIIKPNATVVVYTNTQQKYLPSVYSKFEGLVQEYKIVAYIEELGVLCYGNDTYFYDMNRYVNDIMSTDFIEMTYNQYIIGHNEKLVRENPDAPMLNSMPPMMQGVQMNEHGTNAPILREIIHNNNPVLTNLSNRGVKVQILKG